MGPVTAPGAAQLLGPLVAALCLEAAQEVPFPFPCPCKVVGQPWPWQSVQAAVPLLLLGAMAAALPQLALSDFGADRREGS